MPLPDLSEVCIDLKVTSQELCVTFPGGAEMRVQIPGVPDPTDVSKQLLAQANAALAPLVPVFNIIDAIIALFNCVMVGRSRSRSRSCAKWCAATAMMGRKVLCSRGASSAIDGVRRRSGSPTRREPTNVVPRQKAVATTDLVVVHAPHEAMGFSTAIG